MLFNDVLGQQAAKDSLRQMARSGRVAHALLFTGPSGSGSLSLALAFAQYLLCARPTPTDACGQCPHCLKAAKLIHPDIHFSFPTIGTNVKSDHFLPQWRQAIATNPYLSLNDWLQKIGAENKQGNINKEECLNIIRKMSLKTFESPRKVLIIWRPEFLGKEGNRLLKLIEEPPENTHFILVAEQPDQILNTILSRCQLFKIPALTDSDIVAGLRQWKHLDKEKALAIAQLANGDFNEALHLLEQAENDYAPLFVDWMRRAYVGNGVQLVEWTDRFAKLGRENQKQFIQFGLHFLRELLHLKARPGYAAKLRGDTLRAAQKLTAVVDLDQFEPIVQLLNDCSYYIERNAHPRILFLDAGIQLNHILKTKRRDVKSAKTGTAQG